MVTLILSRCLLDNGYVGARRESMGGLPTDTIRARDTPLTRAVRMGARARCLFPFAPEQERLIGQLLKKLRMDSEAERVLVVDDNADAALLVAEI